MRTIFITIYDGMISKNILRTGVFDVLKNHKDLRIVLIVAKDKKEAYEKEFNHSQVYIESPVKFIHASFEKIWARFFAQIPNTDTIRLLITGSPLSPKKSFLRKFILRFIQIVFDHKICRSVLRTIDKVLFGGRQLAALFDKYKPDLVFAPNVFAVPDVWLLKQAQKRGLRNIGMVKSWDNLTSKGIFRVHPENLIIQNHLLKKEAAELDDYPVEKIFISGIPQYDVYFDDPGFHGRKDFWEKYGIDPDKKIILYLEPGIMLAPHGEEIWLIMEEFLRKGKIKYPAELFISIHPAYSAREEILTRMKQIKFVRLGEYVSDYAKSWEWKDEHMLELMYAVKFSDLVINTGSTMNIEAAILDKPIINIAFDGFKELPYNKSVRQYYDFNHLKNIVETGGVKIARDKEELLEQINELLKNSSISKDGRTKIVEEQCAFADGQSGKRLGEYILSFLK